MSNDNVKTMVDSLADNDNIAETKTHLKVLYKIKLPML